MFPLKSLTVSVPTFPSLVHANTQVGHDSHQSRGLQPQRFSGWGSYPDISAGRTYLLQDGHRDLDIDSSTCHSRFLTVAP